MKFRCTIIIDKPINRVVELFEDQETLKHTQKGLLCIEHISGNKGEAGAKSKLVYKKFDLLETIIHNKLPDEFSASYEHNHMTNTMTSKFEVINKNETGFTTDIEYTKFNGFMINLMVKVFPSLFKKQVDKWLTKFKAFAESQKD